MAKWTEKNKDILIERMFRLISGHHFGDHKMIKYYCSPIENFPRSLGEDIADCTQAMNPKVYHELRRKNDKGS
jgi:hypothetical protein